MEEGFHDGEHTAAECDEGAEREIVRIVREMHPRLLDLEGPAEFLRVLGVADEFLLFPDPDVLADEHRDREEQCSTDCHIDEDDQAVDARNEARREKQAHIALTHAFTAGERQREETYEEQEAAAYQGSADLADQRVIPCRFGREPDRAFDEVRYDRQYADEAECDRELVGDDAVQFVRHHDEHEHRNHKHDGRYVKRPENIEADALAEDHKGHIHRGADGHRDHRLGHKPHSLGDAVVDVGLLDAVVLEPLFRELCKEHLGKISHCRAESDRDRYSNKIIGQSKASLNPLIR